MNKINNLKSRSDKLLKTTKVRKAWGEEWQQIKRNWKERKTWGGAWQQVKQDWNTAWEFDRRGMILGLILLMAGSCAVTLLLSSERRVSFSQAGVLCLSLPLIMHINLALTLLFRYHYNEILAGLGAGAIAIAAIPIAVPFGFSVDSNTSTLVSAFIGSAAILAIGTLSYKLVARGVVAITSAGVFTCGFIAVGVVAQAVGGNLLAFLVGVAFGGTISQSSVRINSRAFLIFERAQRFLLQEKKTAPASNELAPLRLDCCNKLELLQIQKTALTVGLAGRRGLGKTTLLRAISESRSSTSKHFESDRDLKNKPKLREARILNLDLFVPTPTEFEEQTFLMAILERLAQMVNKRLIRVLPAVKPYATEQELREKRRLLNYAHLMIIILCFFALAYNFSRLQSTARAPLFSAILSTSDSTVKSVSNSKIYQATQDSLLAELQKLETPLRQSLRDIDDLLNPEIYGNSWNKKDFVIISRFLIAATWDSLKRSTAWPKLDSMKQTFLNYQSILDSIANTEARYEVLADSLDLLSKKLGVARSSIFQLSGWVWFNAAIPLFLLGAYFFSREGEKRFTKSVYERVRNEVALYERTNSLLERLHFQMSFGESHERGLELSRSGFGIWRLISKNVQREMRPFTTISLIDEFRQYVEDTKMYLNYALKTDNPETKERVKITIAIDELDKILNPQKLHDMLKSMKAIFDIEDVYFYLSISEDALETYRLRHVDTKNEIDSAFTHIIPVPPMDALGSLAFFMEYHSGWPHELLPAAIVFGGGVPRDMHRISQVFGTYPAKTNYEYCLNNLAEEDISACRDMLLLNTHLSDEEKQYWLGILNKTRFALRKSVENILKEIESRSLEDFQANNPCNAEMSSQQFHRLRTLLRGMAVKGFIYHEVLRIPTPDSLKTWPQITEIEKTIGDLQKSGSITDWLEKLEAFRDAIFELSRNPLMVWNNLKRVKAANSSRKAEK